MQQKTPAATNQPKKQIRQRTNKNRMPERKNSFPCFDFGAHPLTLLVSGRKPKLIAAGANKIEIRVE